jgi:hypothetical protein
MYEDIEGSGSDYEMEGLYINAVTYIHETGHLLGLDDYYDYNEGEGSDKGLGGADMMDYNIGDHNVYSKLMLGWVTPTVVTSTQEITISSSTESGQFIMILLDYDGTYFSEYLLIDLYTNEGVNATTSSARVIAINRATGVVTLDKAAGITTGFITVQKSYNNEICGIGAVMDDTVTTLYGLDKAQSEWIKPIVKDANNDVGDIVLYEGVSDAAKYKNSKIDMLLAGDEAFKAYQLYMKSYNTVIVKDQLKFHGGAVGYVLNVGSREVVFVNESFVPSGEIWGVETGAWQFHHTDLDFASVDDSVAFERVSGKTYYTALLAMYGNLICENPGGCVRFINCGAKA